MEEGVDGRFQGAGVPLDLGEEKATLERGEEGDGEGVRVGAVRELSGLVQAACMPEYQIDSFWFCSVDRSNSSESLKASPVVISESPDHLIERESTLKSAVASFRAREVPGNRLLSRLTLSAA